MCSNIGMLFLIDSLIISFQHLSTKTFRYVFPIHHIQLFYIFFIDFLLVIFTPKAKSDNFALLGNIMGESSFFHIFSLVFSYMKCVDVMGVFKFYHILWHYRGKISICSLMYSKNSSLANRPIHCMKNFKTPGRNIAMTPLYLSELKMVS